MQSITKFSQLDLTKQYTYADYLTWKFKERVELIKGWILKMSPAPSSSHQFSSRELLLGIGNFFKNTNCQTFDAPFDVRLLDSKKNKKNESVYTVVQPDICVICDLKKLDEKGCIGSPDLIVEIVSPGNSKREMKIKFELYEENLVKEYWVVHPSEKNIMLFVLKSKKYYLHKTFFEEDIMESILFKGLKVKVKDIFKSF